MSQSHWDIESVTFPALMSVICIVSGRELTGALVSSLLTEAPSWQLPGLYTMDLPAVPWTEADAVWPKDSSLNHVVVYLPC